MVPQHWIRQRNYFCNLIAEYEEKGWNAPRHAVEQLKLVNAVIREYKRC